MYVCIHDVCMYVYTHSLSHTHMYRLRDLFFKRDALEALTSAEFAMTLDTSVLGNCQLFFWFFFLVFCHDFGHLGTR